MRGIDLALAWGMIALATLGIFVIYTMRQDGAQCTQNPILYGVQKGSEHVNSPLTCSCSFEKIPQLATFIVTPNGTQFIQPTNPMGDLRYDTSNLNLSKLNFTQAHDGNSS